MGIIKIEFDDIKKRLLFCEHRVLNRHSVSTTKCTIRILYAQVWICEFFIEVEHRVHSCTLNSINEDTFVRTNCNRIYFHKMCVST